MAGTGPPGLGGIDLNFIDLRKEDEALDFYTQVIIASEETLGPTKDW